MLLMVEFLSFHSLLGSHNGQKETTDRHKNNWLIVDVVGVY